MFETPLTGPVTLVAGFILIAIGFFKKRTEGKDTQNVVQRPMRPVQIPFDQLRGIFEDYFLYQERIQGQLPRQHSSLIVQLIGDTPGRAAEHLRTIARDAGEQGVWPVAPNLQAEAFPRVMADIQEVCDHHERKIFAI